jgi:hypothetical protein
MRRRAFLAAALGTLTSARLAEAEKGAAPSPAWELHDFTVSGDRTIGQRFTLLVPKHVGTRKVPLLVALHGLGETHDQRLGAHAWVERYGLGSCYDRLLAPPITRVDPKVRHFTDERLAELNQLLKAQPFRGLAIACPFTPNVYKAPAGREATLEAYAAWLTEVVIPRARKEAHVFTDAAHTYLDGCSLGGYVGIEVFLRKPTHFGAWGSVQGALGAHRVPGYADKLAELVRTHGSRHLHIETSTADSFREVNEALSKALTKKGVAHDFTMPPGPHNQPFLRDSGTLEMLLWHDRLPRQG